MLNIESVLLEIDFCTIVQTTPVANKCNFQSNDSLTSLYLLILYSYFKRSRRVDEKNLSEDFN